MSFQFQKAQKLDLKRHNAVGGQFQAPQAAPCLELALAGGSILLIRLLTSLSTIVQSLEPSIQGSTKLGLTKFDFYLRYKHLDSILQRFSGFLTSSQCFLGHQGPSWTAVYISPLTCMQVDLESWSEVEVKVKVENFTKEYAPLILLLSTIFTAAVGRILSNSQLCILSCSSHRDPNNFWPKWIS
jgi:hypothetical protein